MKLNGAGFATWRSVFFTWQLERLQSFYPRAMWMQKFCIGLRGDWTSAWNKNPLGYKTDKLHQGQEIPWAESSWRLKEEIITYACPALTLAFLGALLGTEHRASWSRGLNHLGHFHILTGDTDGLWMKYSLFIIRAELTLTMALWELFCFLKGPGLSPHWEEAVPPEHPISLAVALQGGQVSKSTLPHLNITKLQHQLSQNLRNRETIPVAAQ